MLSAVRKNICDECDWGVANNAQIHYTQDLYARDKSLGEWETHHLPTSTDCSGALTDIFHKAGAPDPSGYDYGAIGNTGSLYSNSEHVGMADLEPGDFIICFRGAESEHVYIVRNRLAGGDYNLFTHGDESCPKYEKFSSVSSYWNSIGHVVGCRTLPLTDTYKWTVLTGRKVLARTRHPAIWASRHPLAFRKHHNVRFRRDVI